MDAKLIVVSGRTNRGDVALKLPTTIGRSRQATLTVAHPMISRQHCEIYERDGLLMVRDLGSLNGVLLDGRRVTEAPLPPGTEFIVGPLTLRVEYQYAGDLSALPPIQEHTEAAVAEDTSPSVAVTDTTDLALTPIEETVPVEQPQAVEETASVEQPQAAEADADDMGFSFMDETPESSPAAAEAPEFETAGGGASEAPIESETMQFEPAAEAETMQFEAAAEGETTSFEPAAEAETMQFEAAAEAEEPAGETAPSPESPTSDRDAKKKAGGWWPFAGKGAEKDATAARNRRPQNLRRPPSRAESRDPAGPEAGPAGGGASDELAFEALQDEAAGRQQQPAAAKKAAAKPEEEDSISIRSSRAWSNKIGRGGERKRGRLEIKVCGRISLSPPSLLPLCFSRPQPADPHLGKLVALDQQRAFTAIDGTFVDAHEPADVADRGLRVGLEVLVPHLQGAVADGTEFPLPILFPAQQLVMMVPDLPGVEPRQDFGGRFRRGSMPLAGLERTVPRNRLPHPVATAEPNHLGRETPANRVPLRERPKLSRQPNIILMPNTPLAVLVSRARTSRKGIPNRCRVAYRGSLRLYHSCGSPIIPVDRSSQQRYSEPVRSKVQMR